MDLHICNTFFEKELESQNQKPLRAWMHAHPVVMQLQFLPLFYAAPEDRIAVSELPDNPDPRLCLIDEPPKGAIVKDWGPSRAIAAWAKKHELQYAIPDWSRVQTINSKVFSFTETPQLPGAALLHTGEEIEKWLRTTPGPKVLKSPFGTAGGGHQINPDVKRLYTGPLIGEPWVERVIDFSTQWESGQLVGVTRFENEPNGTYKSTFVGEVEKWALDEHLAVAAPLIRKIGNPAHAGVDAFIYLWKGKRRLHPVVEINVRKTMSWVALQLPAKRLAYTHSHMGALPSGLGKIRFLRNVLISPDDTQTT